MGVGIVKRLDLDTDCHVAAMTAAVVQLPPYFAGRPSQTMMTWWEILRVELLAIEPFRPG
jgi:hypothetical protein